MLLRQADRFGVSAGSVVTVIPGAQNVCKKEQSVHVVINHEDGSLPFVGKYHGRPSTPLPLSV